jgi:hypothetical protein
MYVYIYIIYYIYICILPVYISEYIEFKYEYIY